MATRVRSVPDPTFNIEGETLSYPTDFRDGMSLMGSFLVPSKAAEALLADSPFEPAEVLPGRTLFLLNCVHYTDTDCGVYEEIAFAVPAKHHSQRVSRIGTLKGFTNGGDVYTYTWNLGVNSKLSQQAGIQMWGFPKQMADLTWQDDGTDTSMIWNDGDNLVMKFTVPSGGTQESGPISPPVLSAMHGKPYVGYLTQSYSQVGYKPGAGSLELGDHPVADELKSLGLPKRPLVSIWNGHLEFEMSAPEPIKH